MLKKNFYIIGGVVVATLLVGTFIFGQLSPEDSSGLFRGKKSPSTLVQPQPSSLPVTVNNSRPVMQVAPVNNNNNNDIAPEESNSDDARLNCLDNCGADYNNCLGDNTAGLSTEAFNALESGCSGTRSACRSEC